MKTFQMIRNADETGISGTGKVLEGCVFEDGVTVIRWCTKQSPHTTAVYDTFKDFMFFHVDSHPDNKTEIIWSPDTCVHDHADCEYC